MADIQRVHQIIDELLKDKTYPCYDCGEKTSNYSVRTHISNKNKAVMLDIVSVCERCRKEENKD